MRDFADRLSHPDKTWYFRLTWDVVNHSDAIDRINNIGTNDADAQSWWTNDGAYRTNHEVHFDPVYTAVRHARTAGRISSLSTLSGYPNLGARGGP